MRRSCVAVLLSLTSMRAFGQLAAWGNDPLYQRVSFAAQRHVETLTAEIEKQFIALRRDNGDIAWVEWSPRGENGGSYLRVLGRRAIFAKDGEFSLPPGASFVFKTPGADARSYATDSGFSFPANRSKMAEIAAQVASRARPLGQPVEPWIGQVRLGRFFMTETKADWTDGDIVRVDWAESTDSVNFRKYLVVVSGKITPGAGEVIVFGFGEYEIADQTVFDYKGSGVDYVVRYKAKRSFPIRKDGMTNLNTMTRTFVEFVERRNGA